MADEVKKEEEVKAVPEVSDIQAGLQEILEKKQAERKLEAKKAEAKTNIVTTLAEMVDDAMKAAAPINLGSPAILKYGRGDSENKAFWHYMRTGDAKAYKADVTLNEGDDESGGALVPKDFSARIVEKRGEASILRQGGAEILTTSLKTIDIPVEGTVEAAPASTNESAGATPVSYSMNSVEPVDTVEVSVTKYTRLHRISEELVNDQKADLEGFLARRVGRAFALLENTLFITPGTSGSVVYGSTKGKDAAAATTIAAGDVTGLYYSLPEYYRDGAVWIMASATEGAIRTLEGNPFLFMATPQGQAGSIGNNPLMGHRCFNAAAMTAIGANAKSVFFGNLNYYTLVENGGFRVKRLNERFADTGEIGFTFSVRLGGAVTQAGALMHLLHPSA